MAWTQFEFSWSWSCDEDLDSRINIWDLLSVPGRSREGSDGSRSEEGEEDKQERNFGWLLSLRFHRILWIINYILDLSHFEAKNGLSNFHISQYLAIGFPRNAVPPAHFCFSIRRTKLVLEEKVQGNLNIPRAVLYMWLSQICLVCI